MSTRRLWCLFGAFRNFSKSLTDKWLNDLEKFENRTKIHPNPCGCLFPVSLFSLKCFTYLPRALP